MRVPIVIGNWKMHRTLDQSRALASAVRAALAGVSPAACEVALAPSFPCLAAVGESLSGSEIGLAAQDCHHEAEGAFTGAVSCEQLASLGARTVIVGHSERRRHFREQDEEINLKVRAALAAGLRPIFCVGETEAERQAGRTFAVVSRQVAIGLDGLNAREVGPLVLAYEPVWAIGTGRNATPAEAQEVHVFLRGALEGRFGAAVAAATRIQYGGSVKAGNAAEIMASPDVDGALVGGASLDAAAFAAIVRATASAKASRAA